MDYNAGRGVATYPFSIVTTAAESGYPTSRAGARDAPTLIRARLEGSPPERVSKAALRTIHHATSRLVAER